LINALRATDKWSILSLLISFPYGKLTVRASISIETDFLILIGLPVRALIKRPFECPLTLPATTYRQQKTATAYAAAARVIINVL
jgi:hypothetical protein